MSTKPFVPYRVCCGQQHVGPQCPDGLVMCCLCFDRFPINELNAIGDEVEDVCKPCARADGHASDF